MVFDLGFEIAGGSFWTAFSASSAMGLNVYSLAIAAIGSIVLLVAYAPASNLMLDDRYDQAFASAELTLINARIARERVQ